MFSSFILVVHLPYHFLFSSTSLFYPPSNSPSLFSVILVPQNLISLLLLAFFLSSVTLLWFDLSLLFNFSFIGLEIIVSSLLFIHLPFSSSLSFIRSIHLPSLPRLCHYTPAISVLVIQPFISCIFLTLSPYFALYSSPFTCLNHVLPFPFSPL